MKKRVLFLLVISLLISLIAGCDCNKKKPPVDTKTIDTAKTFEAGKTIAGSKNLQKLLYEEIKKEVTNVSVDLNAVSFLTPARGIAVGENGTVLLTRNGGFTWRTVSSHTVRTLYGADIVDSVLAVAVGEGGTIIRSKDAGITWDSVASENSLHNNTLRCVAFSSSTEGFAVGDGIIFNTKDGGITWKLVYSDASQEYYGISFDSDNIPVIAGVRGVILNSKDLGNTWDSSNVTTRNFRSIHFAETNIPFKHSKKGFAVGDGGIIYKTVNNGQSWTTEVNSDTASLKGVFLTSEKWGHAVGNGGTILRYNGTSWKKLPVVTAARLNGVDPTWNPVTTCVGEDGLVMAVYPPEVIGGSTAEMTGESECLWNFVVDARNLTVEYGDARVTYQVFEVCSSIEQSDANGLPMTGWAQMERYFSKSVTLTDGGHYSSQDNNLSPLRLVVNPSGGPTTGIVSMFYYSTAGNPYIFSSYQVSCP